MSRASGMSDGVPSRHAPSSDEDVRADADLGRRIVKLMIDAGMTRADLARGAGLSRSVVTRILQGTRRAHAHHLRAIAKALGAPSAADLMPPVASTPEEAGSAASVIGRYIATHADDLGMRQRRILERLQARFHAGARLSDEDVARLLDVIREEYHQTP